MTLIGSALTLIHLLFSWIYNEYTVYRWHIEHCKKDNQSLWWAVHTGGSSGETSEYDTALGKGRKDSGPMA